MPNNNYIEEKEYADSLKIAAALPLYFSKYHFADGGYNDAFFKIKIGPIFIPIPNIKSRVEAVKIHDIHHILTEYKANWKGEIQISAWEIASGCNTYWAAWLLNLASVIIGTFLFPAAMYHAFVAGRRAKTNLYQKALPYSSLLEMTVGELRQYVGLV